MKIVFNEVTWYSKLAAVILFIGIVPILTFYIGKQYGEVMVLSNQPVYSSSEPAIISIVPSPQVLNTKDIRFFTATTPISNAAGSYSNIVGYFASGNFFFYVPQWVPDNWRIINIPDGGMRLTLKDVNSVDFSDIVISVSTTTERNNAETLYSKDASTADKAACISGSRCEVREEGSSIISSEILLSRVGDTRIYHIAEELSNGTIEDTFYIDGNKMTATITFSATKESYPVYENKIREFVQGIGKGEGARG